MNPDESRVTPGIRIILAEDHHVVRGGIRALLEQQIDMAVVGEAGDGKEAVALLEKGKEADLILTDIHMPEMNGIELIEHIHAIQPEMKIIVLSMLDNEKFIVKAFRSGAAGYLLKNVSAEELIFAVRHACAGGNYLCAEVSMRFIKRLVRTPDVVTYNATEDFQLTERDYEALRLIAEGLTNQEMADKMFTSKRTVEGYRQQLMNKTGTRNTAALISFAYTHKLLP